MLVCSNGAGLPYANFSARRAFAPITDVSGAARTGLLPEETDNCTEGVSDDRPVSGR